MPGSGRQRDHPIDLADLALEQLHSFMQHRQLFPSFRGSQLGLHRLMPFFLQRFELEAQRSCERLATAIGPVFALEERCRQMGSERCHALQGNSQVPSDPHLGKA